MSDIEVVLNQLVGLCLCRSRNFFATRHFYFSDCECDPASGQVCTLVLECPWRIETEGAILTGCEDFSLQADDNDDPAWEAGMADGHLEDQRLRKFFGSRVQGESVATRRIQVVAVDVDRIGGFRIRFSGGSVLAAFPTSAREMEWMLMGKIEKKGVFINGSFQRLKPS